MGSHMHSSSSSSLQAADQADSPWMDQGIACCLLHARHCLRQQCHGHTCDRCFCARSRLHLSFDSKLVSLMCLGRQSILILGRSCSGRLVVEMHMITVMNAK